MNADVEKSKPSAQASPAPKFRVENNRIYLGAKPIANFAAKIVAKIAEDGVAKAIRYRLEGTRRDGAALRPIEIGASELKRMDWIADNWGIECEISRGANKALALKAIRKLSGRYPEIRCHDAPGYVEIAPNEWIYVTEDWAIGENGVDRAHRLKARESADYPVRAWDDPAKVPAEDLKECLRRTMALAELDASPYRIGALMLIAGFMPLLNFAWTIPFSLFLVGEKGTGKTSTAMLARGFFDKSGKPPPSWKSSEGALLGIAKANRHGVAVFDDFAFQKAKGGGGNAFGIKAENVLRTVASNREIDKMVNATRLSEGRTLNVLAISTGEAIPPDSLESLHDRIVYVPVEEGDIDFEKLKTLAKRAKRGDFAKVAAQFVQSEIRDGIDRDGKAVSRNLETFLEVASDEHDLSPRRAVQFAMLATTWYMVAYFMVANGLWDEDDINDRGIEGEIAIGKLLRDQDLLIGGRSASETITAAIAAGLRKERYYVLNAETGAPFEGGNPKNYGYGEKGTTADLASEERSRDRLGWYDAENKRLYVKSDFPVGRIVEGLPAAARERFGASDKKFWKGMRENGALIERDENCNTVRRRFGQNRRGCPVYCLAIDLEKAA